ncbi:helix-turn-helix domain-containing protein [Micromonospora sp. LOL_015]|uniref:helix-turn-helix domain-containing protein n=1 Tax=Micromonospora sp. LOL_015 TaxID=3345416 RepID=UPI003A8869F2
MGHDARRYRHARQSIPGRKLPRYGPEGQAAVSSNGIPQVLRFLRSLNGGMTQEQLAQQLSVSTSLIAKFETGRQIPMPDTADHIDQVFSSAPLIKELSENARKSIPPDWFRALPELEQEASAIRRYECQIIPGLLQTEAYARAILHSGLLTPAKADEYLALRMTRQAAVFEREEPPVCQFIIDEDGLRRGDPVIMREQLEHIAEMSTRSRVLVQVAPVSAGLHPGQNGPFMLASMAETGGTVGYVDDQLEGRLVTDPKRVATLEQAWQALSGVALPRDQSRDMILKLVKEL